MGRELGGRPRREGTLVYLRLILVDVGQETTKFYKATILQLKKERMNQICIKDKGVEDGP